MGKSYVGTSGFAYREWRPSFYPDKTPATEFLPYYASKLGAVEIDYTFYRMPNAKTLTGWRETTPDGFKFAIKASQKITHFERLKLPSGSHDYLQAVLPTLGDRLGVLFYQLPPNFRCSLERLETFLASCSASIPTAFEFRHESWFVPEVYALLARRGVGLVINDGDEGCTPLERTAPLVYLRLRKSEYSDEERELWLARIRAWARDGEVFAFVKHEDAQYNPTGLALELTRSLADDGILEVPRVELVEAVAGA
jgi:uncharacterized protein YecE (DUF72 family)